MADWSYIDTPEALNALCGKLAAAEWLTVDTEFVRERTYFPQLCLVQIGSPEHLACIDPLRLDDLTPLFALLRDPGITKVFHAARQDLELFFQLMGEVPAPIFDTQIAAALCGWADQVGYATLVQDICDASVDKSHARTDWSRRPLDPEAISYAVDDVRYLRDIYARLRERLVELGRDTWVAPENAALAEPALYMPAPDTAWRRIRGQQKLRPAQRGRLAALAAWREREAIERNRPRKWLIKDEVLLDIARRNPADREALMKIRGMSDGQAGRHADALLNVLASAAGDIDAPPIPGRLTPAQEAVADLMTAVVRMKSAEQNISQAQLATRKDLDALIRGDTDIALLKGWRRAALGEMLLQLLNGGLGLRVEDGKPVIEALSD